MRDPAKRLDLLLLKQRFHLGNLDGQALDVPIDQFLHVRIVERLLTDFMGYTAAEAHVYADDIGETFSDDMVERMEEKLGNPDRCPHGWPVDPAFEQAENAELAPLAALEAPAKATIVRLAEHDGELLHWFYDEGFTPGAHVVIREAQPAAGQFKVLLGGTERAIGEKAAAGLYVRPS